MGALLLSKLDLRGSTIAYSDYLELGAVLEAKSYFPRLFAKSASQYLVTIKMPNAKYIKIIEHTKMNSWVKQSFAPNRSSQVHLLGKIECVGHVHTNIARISVLSSRGSRLHATRCG